MDIVNILLGMSSLPFLLLFPLLVFSFCECLIRFLLLLFNGEGSMFRVLILSGLLVKEAEPHGNSVEAGLFCVVPKYVLFSRFFKKWIEMQTETRVLLLPLPFHNFLVTSTVAMVSDVYRSQIRLSRTTPSLQMSCSQTTRTGSLAVLFLLRLKQFPKSTVSFFTISTPLVAAVCVFSRGLLFSQCGLVSQEVIFIYWKQNTKENI